MAYQSLGLGSSAGDGTGDTIRAGGDKINDNFSEIYTLLGTGTALTSGISATATVVSLSGPTITGVASFADGSNSAPSITNTGDTNTGIYFGAADTVSVTTGGTKRLDVDSSGIDVVGAITATTTVTAGTAAVPDAADGATLGTASLEWSDLYLADGGVIYFGNDQEVKMTHEADSGLQLKHTSTSDDATFTLTLQTGETDMAANDVLGKLNFQAPDEGAGTDAILVGASIRAVAEGDFSSSSNATALHFHTASSEAADSAAAGMTLSSANLLTVTGAFTGGGLMTTGGNIVIPNAGNIGSASDTDAMAIASNGVVTFSQIPVLPANTISETMMQDDAISSNELKTLSTLLIKNSGGSTLATFHTAGA